MGKLPDPIYIVSKTGEVITMEALTPTSYEKCYFPSYEIGKRLVNPRKVKVVNIDNVEAVFKEFIASGYAIIPQ